jgi:hypothetical protein
VQQVSLRYAELASWQIAATHFILQRVSEAGGRLKERAEDSSSRRILRASLAKNFQAKNRLEDDLCG